MPSTALVHLPDHDARTEDTVLEYRNDTAALIFALIGSVCLVVTGIGMIIANSVLTLAFLAFAAIAGLSWLIETKKAPAPVGRHRAA